MKRDQHRMFKMKQRAPCIRHNFSLKLDMNRSYSIAHCIQIKANYSLISFLCREVKKCGWISTQRPLKFLYFYFDQENNSKNNTCIRPLL